MVTGFAVNGINNVNTTSYERRFQLTSSQVGWISSAFDIAAAVFGVIIGFCGNRRHKARILTVAFFVASLGSLCMFLPHFMTGLYQWGQQTAKDQACDSGKGLFYNIEEMPFCHYCLCFNYDCSLYIIYSSLVKLHSLKCNINPYMPRRSAHPY